MFWFDSFSVRGKKVLAIILVWEQRLDIACYVIPPQIYNQIKNIVVVKSYKLLE